MAKKELQLKTKRLCISPMTDEELRQLAEETTDQELRQAYEEMLEGSLNNREFRLWYTAWKICLKGNGQIIGTEGFKGPADTYSVEIGYGIDKEYEGNGYATEAVKALIEWAFTQENVYYIEAESAMDNVGSRKVLEKLSFQPDGMGKEGERYILEKTEAMWMPIYMCFGLSIGLSLGNASGNMSIGMCLGMAIGLCIGSALDASNKKRRAKIKEERMKK